LTDDREEASDSIVPGVGGGLTKPALGLICRGLLELTNLKDDQKRDLRTAERASVLLVENQEAIRLKPDDATAWYDLGFAYNQLQQYDKAIPALQEAIRLKPDYANAWYGFGINYAHLQQYDQAISALQEAIRLEPGDNRAWNGLGVTYLRLQQYDKAIAALQEAIRLKPDYASAWCNLGIVYSFQGDRSRVMAVYERLKTLDQNLAEDFFRKMGSP
jgi:tetratricopeptide (TPR) repeat protein